jgi:hypoxanthine phosphoribosyltransferase
MGALISGCLGHRSLVVIDRKYIWREGDRFDDMIFPVNIPQDFLERVLIVSGGVHSGNTMKFYYDHFRKLGAKYIRRATLYYEKGAIIKVEYKGLESIRKNILMPWIFTKQYIRADRGPTRTTLLKKESSTKDDESSE